MNSVEPLVPGDRHVLVLPQLTEVAQDPDLRRQLLVVGHDGSRVAVRTEVLAGVEAERGDPPERAAAPPLVLGAVGLRSVFDEHKAVLGADRVDCVRVARVTEEIDAGDRLRPRGHGGRRLLDIDLAVAVAVDQDRPRAEARRAA